MEKNWIRIFMTTNFLQAEMIRQALASNDIPAVILNKQDSSYRFGRVELYAHEMHEQAAQTIISDMLKDEDLS